MKNDLPSRHLELKINLPEAFRQTLSKLLGALIGSLATAWDPSPQFQRSFKVYNIKD